MTIWIDDGSENGLLVNCGNCTFAVEDPTEKPVYLRLGPAGGHAGDVGIERAGASRSGVGATRGPARFPLPSPSGGTAGQGLRMGLAEGPAPPGGTRRSIVTIKPKDVHCATCSALPGEGCTTLGARCSTRPHLPRVNLALANVPCGSCGAVTERPCVNRQGRPRTRMHLGRMKTAAQARRNGA